MLLHVWCKLTQNKRAQFVLPALLMHLAKNGLDKAAISCNSNLDISKFDQNKNSLFSILKIKNSNSAVARLATITNVAGQ